MTFNELGCRRPYVGRMISEEMNWKERSKSRQLAHYGALVFGKWRALGFVGGLGTLIGLILLFVEKPLPWWGWLLIVMIALTTAQYETFHDVMIRLVQANEDLMREKDLSQQRVERSPLDELGLLVTHGEALVDSLTSKAHRDPDEGDAKALDPAVEEWAKKCRALLQWHWPSEVGSFDARSDKAFADTYFYGTHTARLLGFVRPRVGKLKAILIRVS